MSAAADLYAILSAYGALTAVVGDRIYPIVVPERDANGTPVPMPAIAYRRSNTEYVNTIHGPPIASDVSFDIVCGAKTPIEAETLADIVEGVSGVVFLNRADDFDSETGIYANVLTVTLLTQ